MSSKNYSPVSDESTTPFGQTTLFKLLQDSMNREKDLKRRLDEQRKENDRLQLELSMQKKAQVNVKSFSEMSEESETNVQEVSSMNELHDIDPSVTFGTKSTMLMQFKYDELQHSYSKCVHKLVKKSSQLKKVLREAEIDKFINVQLTSKNRELNLKMEQVCFRFFDLMDRRSEELCVHKSHIDELTQKLMLVNHGQFESREGNSSD